MISSVHVTKYAVGQLFWQYYVIFSVYNASHTNITYQQQKTIFRA